MCLDWNRLQIAHAAGSCGSPRLLLIFSRIAESPKSISSDQIAVAIKLSLPLNQALVLDLVTFVGALMDLACP